MQPISLVVDVQALPVFVRQAIKAQYSSVLQVVDDPERRLVAVGASGSTLLYGWEQLPDASTRVRHIVAAPDLPLDDVPDGDAFGGLAVEVTPEVAGAAERRLASIKTLAEEFARADQEKAKSELAAAPQNYRLTATVLFPHWLILLTALVFNSIATAFLLALNWERLGKRQRVLPTILVAILVTPVAYGISMLLFPTLGNLIFVPTGIANLVVVVLLIVLQSKDYSAWKRAVGRTPSIGISGCLLYIVVFIVSSVIIGAMLPTLNSWAVRFTTALRPANTYSDERVSFTYPGYWLANPQLESGAQSVCRLGDCLVATTQLEGFSGFLVVRLPAEKLSFDQFVDTQEQSMRAVNTVRIVSSEDGELQGRAFTRLRYTNDVTPIVEGVMVFIEEDDESVLWVILSESGDDFDAHRAEIDQTIANMQFKE